MYHLNLKYTAIILTIILGNLIIPHCTFDDEDDASFHEGKDSDHRQMSNTEDSKQTLPKDKILLSEVKNLTFRRNKRTTSRRTHTIPQLSCVGGTAGCKLFTTDLVQCENISPPGKSLHISQIEWRCNANIGDRVKFNHVEVICEGYDYPEDDYILLGSCGLEFTLDYVDPNDFHDKSYFKHMDDHEKELHKSRVKSTSPESQHHTLLSSILTILVENPYYLCVCIAIVVILLLLVRFCLTTKGRHGGNIMPTKQLSKKQHGLAYGQITSAVMTTKKAC